MLAQMLVAACLVIPGAHGVLQNDPAKPAVEVVSEAEAARLLAELGQKTNALKSFVATYRAQVDDQDLTVTMTFEAPDRAKLEWRATRMSVDSWLLGGRQYLRGDFGAEATKAELDWSEIASLGEEYESTVREVFPATAESQSRIGPGPFFMMDVVADAKSPEGRSLNCNLGWESNRRHVLGWLNDAKVWDGARREAGRITRDGAAESTLTLSLETGFFESIQGRKPGLRLEELRIDEDLPGSTFVVPAADPGARDMSADIAAQQSQMVTGIQRGRLYRAGAKAAEGLGIDDAALQAKLERVFESLHAVAQPRAAAAWITNTESRIDAFLGSWGGEYDAARGDSVALQKLDEAAAKWRGGLQGTLEKSVDSHVARLSPPRQLDLDSGLLAAIAAIEAKAARRVHERVLSAPLLLRFDDGVRAVTSGR